ncbi:MAG: 50S ribosomal protein L11 [Candidatus Dojkabacteria bacterium]|nr:50S ribosomal protein L11 [Candidatus Dojkabacteria bacterium]
MAKKINSKFKMVIPAGKATPAPPYGPILGQNGINIQEFCTQFNDKTRDMRGYDIPVGVTVYDDRTFIMDIKKPTVTSLIKKEFNIQKGSAEPNKVKIKKVNLSDLTKLAEMKLEDLNTKDIEAATRIVAGAATSMGIEVIE